VTPAARHDGRSPLARFEERLVIAATRRDGRLLHAPREAGS